MPAPLNKIGDAMHQSNSWLDKISIAMHSIGAVWMFLLMFLITSDVFCRVIFNHPIAGVIELTKASLVFICFLLLPAATASMKHIRSDVLVSRLGPLSQNVLAVLRFSLGTLLLIAIVVGTWDKMIEAWRIWDYEGEGTIRVPMAPVRTTILLSSLLAAYFFFRLLMNALSSFPKKIGKD